MQNNSTIVKLSQKMTPVTFPGNKILNIPENTSLTQGLGHTTTHSLKVERGDSLASELSTSASLSASYCGVSADTSAQYNYSSSLNASNYYAVVSVDHSSFFLRLKGHKDTYCNINTELISDADKLPEWKENDVSIYNRYVDFFKSWGTHVIKNCTYGARYQLKVETSSTDSKSKEEFGVHVGAEYNGVASVKGSADVKHSDEFKSYLKSRKFETQIYGGQSGSSLILGQAPDDEGKYQDAWANWAKSVNDESADALVNISVDSIGNLLRGSSNPDHQRVSAKLISALDYLTNLAVLECSVTINPGFQNGGQPDITRPKRALPFSATAILSVEGSPGIQLIHEQGYDQKIQIERLGPSEMKMFVDVRYDFDADASGIIPGRTHLTGYKPNSCRLRMIAPPRPAKFTLKKWLVGSSSPDEVAPIRLYIQILPVGPKLLFEENTSTLNVPSLREPGEYFDPDQSARVPYPVSLEQLVRWS
jgi:hypothetical protein